MEAIKNHPENYRAFGNKPLVGNKVYLTSCDKNDYKLALKYVKEDGNFIAFSNDLPTKKAIKNIVSSDIYEKSIYNPPRLGFIIKEKETNNAVGFVGCYCNEINTPYELFYYIFKPYRKQGYAKEAVNMFVDALLNEKFYYPRFSEYDDVLTKKKFKCDLIRCSPNEDNEPSNRLIKSLGFTFVGKDPASRIHPISHTIFSANIYIKTK